MPGVVAHAPLFTGVDRIELVVNPVGAAIGNIGVTCTVAGGTWDIDWGDGTVDTGNATGKVNHDYGSIGERTVIVTGSGLSVIERIDLYTTTSNNSRDSWRNVHIQQIDDLSTVLNAFRECDNILTFQIDTGVWTAASAQATFFHSSSCTDITIDADTSAVENWSTTFADMGALLNLTGGFSFAGATDMTNTFNFASVLNNLDAVGAKVTHSLQRTNLGVANLNTYISNLGNPAGSATLTLPTGRNKTELNAGIVSTAEANGWVINPQS